ncbi:Putative ribosomal N-acetyltransferase YdaF [Bacillus sp. T2.9-1]|uniref:GNAT family N-acetyltransferase n=1 Tax=Bacillus sp. T2.9-1 TaxID=3041163 RepID=UPI002477323B|nr:GNAT family protein [Bacillus sp. T2.9-1]CAI9390575.1 Putative ribosomal N-acetyltransferase YdaF [Bacillus sp. T2.9-1]
MFQHTIDKDLALRVFRLDDAEEFFQLTIKNKAYLKEWLGWLDYTNTVEDTKENIRGRLQGMVETGGYPKSVVISYKGKIAGTIGYNEINRTSRIGKIGYWLGEEYQGKGIMTKACEAFITYGFTELDLNRIEIAAATGNKKSRALPERLKFTEEGTIRQAEWLYDHYVDHVIYGLLREEWARNHS